MSQVKFITLIIFTALVVVSFKSDYENRQNPWKAPASADSIISPYLVEPLTLPQGQEIYTIYCASCHGHQGKADGIAAKNLSIKPLGFQDKKFTDQTNGAIFWKIREGRGEMPSFRGILSDEQKWQMVEYIRDISKPFDDQMNPLKSQ